MSYSNEYGTTYSQKPGTYPEWRYSNITLSTNLKVGPFSTFTLLGEIIGAEKHDGKLTSEIANNNKN